jgi:hypothetical protein
VVKIEASSISAARSETFAAVHYSIRWRPAPPALRQDFTLDSMKTVYSLRTDPDLASMQAASRESGKIGLRQTHGLVGSPEWWAHIEEGSLSISTTAGTVIHFFPGHHGDWPEIEMREPDGTSSSWGCLVPAAEAEKYFMPGAKVEFDHIRQELKVPFNGSNATRLVIAIRVESNK